MPLSIWQKCLEYLKEEGTNQAIDAWLSSVNVNMDDDSLILNAPCTPMTNAVEKSFFIRIKELIILLGEGKIKDVRIKVNQTVESSSVLVNNVIEDKHTIKQKKIIYNNEYQANNFLNKKLIYDNFIEGNANQLARESSIQVAENIGKKYNPFFIYGGIGLGKTHLMHALGNYILKKI